MMITRFISKFGMLDIWLMIDWNQSQYAREKEMSVDKYLFSTNVILGDTFGHFNNSLQIFDLGSQSKP